MHAFLRRPVRLLLPALAALVLGAGFGPSDARAQVNVTIGSGAALQGGTLTLNVSGNWTNNGTFTPDSSTVVFVGSAAQSVSGTDTFFGFGIDKGLSKSSTFTLGSPTTVQGRLELTSGSLDNSTSNVALGDGATIRRAAGSLSAVPAFGASVNVEYAGDGTVSTGNELPDPTSGTTVGTLAVDGSASVTLTKPVTVTQSLALRGGSLDNSTNPVTVASGAQVEPGGGSLQATPTYDGPVEITYDGDGALTTGVELPGTVDRLTVQAPGGLTLATDVTVTDVLAIEQGTMDLGGFTVTLDGSARLEEQPGAVVRGASGQIQAVRTLNAPSQVDVAGLGFTITSAADLGSTTVTRTHARPFDATNTAAARVYDVAPTNDGGLDATIIVRYDESELTSPDVEGPLELYVSTDGGSTWSLKGGTVDEAANTVTATGIDALSQWTVGAPISALPVEMAGLDGRVDNDAALLAWQTLSELNNAGFEVQHRGPEAEAFGAHGFVRGAGTTDRAQTYTYRAAGLEPGVHTFRLKQMDVDGVSTLTDVVELRVDVPRVVSLRPNYPNPVRETTNLAFTVAAAGPAKVDVFNLLGQRIATLYDAPAAAGQVHRLAVDTRRWASGVYFYTLTANGQRKVGRMTVVR